MSSQSYDKIKTIVFLDILGTKLQHCYINVFFWVYDKIELALLHDIFVTKL